MGPLDLIPVIGGVASAALDASSGVTSARMAREAYRSRYQDTVRDMRRAGLNPALAYGQGGGPGASGQSIPELGSSFARGASAAANAKQSIASADLTGAQAALLKAQAADLVDQVDLRNNLLRRESGLTAAKTTTERQRRQSIAIQNTIERRRNALEGATYSARLDMIYNDLQRSNISVTRAEIEKELLRLQQPEARAQAQFFEGAGKYSPYLNSALDVVRTLMPKVTLGGKGTEIITEVQKHRRGSTTRSTRRPIK